jgi:hypothetical protein
MVLVREISNKKLSHIENKFHAKRSDAFNRCLTFKFTLAEFRRWYIDTPEVCVYCGINYEVFKKVREFAQGYIGYNKLIRRYKKLVFQTSKGLTIERFDDNQGYTPINIGKCCLHCQMLKNQAKEAGVTDIKEVIQIIRAKTKQLIVALFNEGFELQKEKK